LKCECALQNSFSKKTFFSSFDKKLLLWKDSKSSKFIEARSIHPKWASPRIVKRIDGCWDNENGWRGKCIFEGEVGEVSRLNRIGWDWGPKRMELSGKEVSRIPVIFLFSTANPLLQKNQGNSTNSTCKLKEKH
jgi:hypothetical protein